MREYVLPTGSLNCISVFVASKIATPLAWSPLAPCDNIILLCPALLELLALKFTQGGEKADAMANPEMSRSLAAILLKNDAEHEDFLLSVKKKE
jgi:hypothetical protein